MNREDIIRMAREAGFEELGSRSDDWVCFGEELERFAALVAASEREACAKVCDESAAYQKNYLNTHASGVVATCAAAIRARSNT